MRSEMRLHTEAINYLQAYQLVLNYLFQLETTAYSSGRGASIDNINQRQHYIGTSIVPSHIELSFQSLECLRIQGRTRRVNLVLSDAETNLKLPSS
jgi:hypothetical protein